MGDAHVIAFNTVIDPNTVCTVAQRNSPTSATLKSYPVYRSDDSHCRVLERRWKYCVDILAALPVVGTGSFHQNTMLRHARPTSCVSWTLDQRMQNEDIYGRTATTVDTQVLSDALAQLDYWIVTRQNRFVPRPLAQPTDLISWGGETVDFILCLVGRKLGVPGIQDRFSDANPNAATSSEIFINLDLAAERGIDSTVDIDTASFARKDMFHTLADGTDATNTVYFRLASNELPSQFRTTESRTVLSAQGWMRESV